MSKSTRQLSLLLGGLLLTVVSMGSASAGEINPYSADAQKVEELDVNDPGQATSETGAAGSFNLSPKAGSFEDLPTSDSTADGPAFSDMDILLMPADESSLLGKVESEASIPSTEETTITNKDFNFPVPEPSSLVIWIVLGICGGFLIRRRAKLHSHL